MGRHALGSNPPCSNCKYRIGHKGGRLCTPCSLDPLACQEHPTEVKFRPGRDGSKPPPKLNRCQPTAVTIGFRYLAVWIKDETGTRKFDPRFELNLKLEVLIARAERGEQLWHAKDERHRL